MSRGERLDHFIRQSTPVLLIGLFLFVVTTAGALLALGEAGWSWYDHKYRWRVAEYRRLNALHAGFTERKFEELLGTPAFYEISDDRRWSERTYRGRGYWLQTVARRGSNAVAFFAITSCSQSFNPTFRLPDGTRITLNKSTLASIDLPFATADYFAPGATANAHFYDILSGGNPENYKSFAWGFNDPCLNMRRWDQFADVRTFGEFGGSYQGPSEGGGAGIQAFRQKLPVNTYAETAPTVGFAEGARHFQVGPDRILIRTVTQVISTSYRGEPAPAPSDEDRFGARLTARQRVVAYCVSSPLRTAAFVIAGGSLYGVPRPDVRRWRSYVGNRFLDVGLFSKESRRQQRVILLFTKDEASAVRVAKAVKERERGVVRRSSDIVLVWTTRPTQGEEEAVSGCLYPG